MKTRVLLMCGALSLLFGGCSSLPNLGGGPANTPEAGERIRTAAAPGDFKDALCEGRPDLALARLPARVGDDPALQLYAAYALEKSGHGMRARPHFERLAERGLTNMVRLNCPGETMLAGPLSAVAAERVLAINAMLRLMDADMSITDRLHRGLPAASPSQPKRGAANAKSPSRPKPTPKRSAGPITALETPASLNPLGRWFVHLASYSAGESAVTGREELARQYPALRNAFDSWQIDLNGGRTWRIGVRTSDQAEAEAMCATLERYGRYCAVLDANSRIGQSG